MKIFEIILDIILRMAVLVCAVINFTTGNYVQACFWTLWLIALNIGGQKA